MKAEIVLVRTKIIEDPNISTLTGQTEETLAENVIGTKYVPDIADKDFKISIYQSDRKELNRRLDEIILAIDVHIPLMIQTGSGIGLDILEELEKSLPGLSLGRGLHHENTLADGETTKGWWKGTISFWYHAAKKN